MIVLAWLRLGVIGFGGPPAHIGLLRTLCVDRHGWISAAQFEDAVATTNALPGPASTQLAIYCAWVVGGPIGAVLGGVCFIAPGLMIILGLSALFLASHPPALVLGAALGAGAAVPAVALGASWQLVPASRARMGTARAERLRWVLYAAIGAVAAGVIGQYLVLVIVALGLCEVAVRRRGSAPSKRRHAAIVPGVVGHGLVLGSWAGLAWVALKVGALSYGGGFVIVPLMQHDVVSVYHWMTASQFLGAVALGQVTPGPVVQTVAVVGYAAHGVAGGLLAALVAFAPSFTFVLIGARSFERIRSNATIGSFLTGAGATVIGAIAGAAVPLALALSHLWQIPVALAAAVWLLILRRSTVVAIACAALIGVVVALIGGAVTG